MQKLKKLKRFQSKKFKGRRKPFKLDILKAEQIIKEVAIINN